PLSYRPAREVASYFQALAFLRDGVGSVFYATPAESRASIHLYDLLVVPLLMTGYQEAGRFISLLAAALSPFVLYRGIQDQWSTEIGILAGTFLWIQPLFIRHAYAFMPEALSILVTLAAISWSLKSPWPDLPDYAGKLILFGILFIGPFVHMWEAYIALPIFGVFIHRRDFFTALLAGTASTAAVITNFIVTSWQPANAAVYTRSHTFIRSGFDVYFTSRFWFGRVIHEPSDLVFFWFNNIIPSPFEVTESIALLFAIFATTYWIVRWYRNQTPRITMMVLWFISALAVPFVLSRGYYTHHSYFQWVFIGPFAVTIAIWSDDLIGRLSDLDIALSRETILTGAVIVLVGLAGVQIGVNELKGFQGGGSVHESMTVGGVSHEEAVTAGRAIPPHITEAPNVCFVGDDWKGQTVKHYESNYDISTILVYSNVLPKGTFITSEGGPQLISTNETVPSSCEVTLRRDGRFVSVNTTG
ncbi:MAG: hypothetical protein ABEI86_05545, partial [Halobacteriaceae archaeon]